MEARERRSVRVLLISPRKRVLLFKYKNTAPDGIERPCWSTAGGGRPRDETIEQTASREILEETGMSDVRWGPVVWYGENGVRAGDGTIVFKEHFIVAHALTEVVDTGGWTGWERDQITDIRWWTSDELRHTTENIFPRDLGALIEPILAGVYPTELITLPPI